MASLVRACGRIWFLATTRQRVFHIRKKLLRHNVVPPALVHVKLRIYIEELYSEFLQTSYDRAPAKLPLPPRRAKVQAARKPKVKILAQAYTITYTIH